MTSRREFLGAALAVAMTPALLEFAQPARPCVHCGGGPLVALLSDIVPAPPGAGLCRACTGICMVFECAGGAFSAVWSGGALAAAYYASTADRVWRFDGGWRKVKDRSLKAIEGVAFRRRRWV